ncbi:hypothetical protein [Telmatospirillum sp. J64-1]|uniref:hypothetical protein n=1 Tax=Telmatospirillum sp. J64-1 TaxID=2502183 RepID=UPI00115F5871|nr:hypothetical protein [Telmatospirillum sp. J64-1]
MADRFKAVLLAATISYVLVVHGLITAYAHAAMAVPQSGLPFILCSFQGNTAPDTAHPLQDLAHTSCSAVCQAACAAAPMVSAEAHAVVFDLGAETRIARSDQISRAPPADPGRVPEARAPPSFSF